MINNNVAFSDVLKISVINQEIVGRLCLLKNASTYEGLRKHIKETLKVIGRHDSWFKVYSYHRDKFNRRSIDLIQARKRGMLWFKEQFEHLKKGNAYKKLPKSFPNDKNCLDFVLDWYEKGSWKFGRDGPIINCWKFFTWVCNELVGCGGVEELRGVAEINELVNSSQIISNDSYVRIGSLKFLIPEDLKKIIFSKIDLMSINSLKIVYELETDIGELIWYLENVFIEDPAKSCEHVTDVDEAEISANEINQWFCASFFKLNDEHFIAIKEHVLTCMCNLVFLLISTSEKDLPSDLFKDKCLKADKEKGNTRSKKARELATEELEDRVRNHPEMPSYIGQPVVDQVEWIEDIISSIKEDPNVHNIVKEGLKKPSNVITQVRKKILGKSPQGWSRS